MCDYQVNSPHLTYYLKFKWRWIKDMRLVNTQDLPRCKFVLSWRKSPPGENFVKIIDLKARRRLWTLWVHKSVSADNKVSLSKGKDLSNPTSPENGPIP